ncbi:MAG: tRNA (adenosine(37)-N6)-threonylcarbamoyltransferase complex transferase subunit TsaD [Candidatus Taylorbacteria bacterium RIFCSPHIGHO2_02_FULL_47_18]|uniref:tRNA N6-adenosine threonylcarbamoyltransferase n=1 Tax=Candidatus Taylorbacteria bacterium RIFCSPLOWO2_01_FULL_48_100 TaxID=1802322 RepID=A0A1G2NEF1_9BACT|nr:MAG: tRNA (adenosine(37)-N6)-threonylcarbamoyltransferase complex transferase subunit TsaD [Candidatus Taylorbacteria bacterium RIFCSPHIGHO2_01_FULL_48_38]OHA28269.1 MAG: tRNA (adenosine(37)-N6)-threonylcarbamoyltransferase complex transferase subunit TsaD [Candidatus Taylorbacteria bacterium RIFCSPHIGHO2_02_FULL_47_18]OHA33781.1 MAG: tRNA (adenosine(37)-N6)-threonylcarbamoyltransferase complex transferase subunit TsaD [Candidatus Taylorbacteria bacterium RIFCSPLOWO2_01_FULL_48_100]OHA40597.1
MIILGIETSCDETAVCVIEANGPLEGAEIIICANITLSQARMHAPYGGVFPNLAKREHIKNLPIILKEILRKAKINGEKPKVDAIAVTYGPGLEPCLWAGITFAKTLAEKWSVPIVPVNHMEGHIFSALLRRKENPKHEARSTKHFGFRISSLEFPAVALLVSGGHTELDLMEDYGKYRLIGETRDDAVGEAFDKVARLLGLPYPGGPEISRLAERMRTSASVLPSLVLPRPMLHSPDYDFSFSGIKTAVLYLLKKIGAPSEQIKAEIAREFEDAVTEVLVSKTKRALREYGAQTLIVAGGVIANTHIRSEFGKLAAEEGITLLIPELSHTTDNALMIAVASYATVMNKVEGLPALETIRADGTAKISERNN